jgi:hypothetical protein
MAWQDEYDLVEDRLRKFWEDNPNGRVSTEILYITDDHKSAVFRASIYKDIADEVPVSTGIAQDQHGPKGANQTSWIENGSTSAVGRALANWIYAAKKRPSVTEMQKVENLSAGKTETVTKSVSKTSNSNTYTPSPSVQKKLDQAVQDKDVEGKSVVEKLEATGFGEVVEQKVITNGTVKPECLSCGSDLWDNRADKASGKIKDTYPDWKCKNKDCDNGNPRIYYMESFNASKQAPEVWFMPDLPKGKSIDEVGKDQAPF